MKVLLNKIKSEKEKKNKNFNKIKQLEILLVRIKDADKPEKLEKALKELNKIRVINKNLHDIKNEILLNYVGEFEMDGDLKIGDQIRETLTRFEIMDNFEEYINSLYVDHDSEDTIFNGHIYKLDTPQFIKISRSQYGNGCDIKHEIIQNRGNNCYIPTKGYCFIICVNFLIGEDYKQHHLDFIRNEKRRSNIMTKARIQPFCRANNINLGYFVG